MTQRRVADADSSTGRCLAIGNSSCDCYGCYREFAQVEIRSDQVRNYGDPQCRPSPRCAAAAPERAVNAAKFEPRKVVGFEKIAVGRDMTAAMSMSMTSTGWRGALVWQSPTMRRGTWPSPTASIPVHQFDHTIDRGPCRSPPASTFHKQRVAASMRPAALSLDTLAAQASFKVRTRHSEGRYRRSTNGPFSTPRRRRRLSKFSQIVCEFHGFHHPGELGYSDRCIPFGHGELTTILRGRACARQQRATICERRERGAAGVARGHVREPQSL